MRIIHLSYNIPNPTFTDPEVWLRRINHSIGVLESMSRYAETIREFIIFNFGCVKNKWSNLSFPRL
jgi:hypothetical protein